jgi:hypothetical protein
MPTSLPASQMQQELDGIPSFDYSLSLSPFVRLSISKKQ